jgi:hypothetical protein
MHTVLECSVVTENLPVKVGTDGARHVIKRSLNPLFLS